MTSKHGDALYYVLFLSLNILSIFEHNLFYLTKNHSQAQVFHMITVELINFSNRLDYFFIQAVVPSSNMLQTGEAQKSNENILDAFIHSQINALSFSRSQKVLGWSKFFWPDVKFIYILWQSQNFKSKAKHLFWGVAFSLSILCTEMKLFMF